VAVDSDFTYTATVKKNGLEIQDAVLVWESSNENIAVINDGVVTGLAIGNVLISVYIEDKPAINTSIEIEVIENVPEVITYRMWSSETNGTAKSYSDFSVRNGTSKLFGVEKYVNGVMTDPNDTYSFSLNPNGTPTSNYIFTVVDAYKIKIEGKGSTYTVILTATSNQSGTIVTQNILLRSLF
jgi:hypothetical protein